MNQQANIPTAKPWTKFCHVHGDFFLSASACDVVCPNCERGKNNDWMKDIFSNAFTGQKK